jgi:hypothetical protein
MNGAKIRRLRAGVFFETWAQSGRQVSAMKVGALEARRNSVVTYW